MSATIRTTATDLDDPTVVDTDAVLLESLRCAVDPIEQKSARLAHALESLPAVATRLGREEIQGLAHALAISADSGIPASLVIARFLDTRSLCDASRLEQARAELLAWCAAEREAHALGDAPAPPLAAVARIEADVSPHGTSLLCWVPSLRPEAADALVAALRDRLGTLGFSEIAVRVMGTPPAYGELPILERA